MAVLAPTSQVVFGSRLLQQLLRRRQENIFVSPASVGFALGMAALGARGKTLSALEHVLDADAKLAANRAKRLFASLESLPDGVKVELANSLWARAGLPLSALFTNAARDGYRAEVRNLDFTSPSAARVVNDWVARSTHGHIGSVVDQIDAGSALVLVNATYFNGLWEDSFSPNDTYDYEFTTGSGRVTKVPMMFMTRSFSYMQARDLQAVRLPYRQGRFSLLVVLPQEFLPPGDFDEIAAPSSLAWILGRLGTKRGSLGLPKVGLVYSADLVPELTEMGLGPVFADDADFSDLFEGNVPAYISKVFHKTRLEIDEHGTTAAASTYMGMSLGIHLDEGPKPFEMIVDRPFLLVLTDSETDLILFIGVIGDPTLSE